MNKNCFLKGVMTGKMLKVRHTGTASSATAGAPSSVADYDKESFLSGLAVGMSTRGVLHWPSVASIIATRASTTDELMMEMYLLDKQGKLEVPKLPGMAWLQEWMEENGFTDISQYDAAKEAFGSEIAWSFFGKDVFLRDFDEDGLPALMPSNHVTTGTFANYWEYYPFSGSSYQGKSIASINSSTSFKTAEIVTNALFRMPDTVPGKVEGEMVVEITLDLPKCKFRLSCISAEPCTPEPLEKDGDFWAGIQFSWGYNETRNYTTSNPTDGVKVNSYNTSMVMGFKPGNSIDITMKEAGEFSFYVVPISTVRSETSLGSGIYSGDVLFAAATSYSASLTWAVEILEMDEKSSNDNALLSDFLRKVDDSGLYFMSQDEGKTLKPFLMVDQTEKFIRDRDNVYISGGRVSPDIRYEADNFTQQYMDAGRIDVTANTVDSTYIHEFHEINGNLEEVDTPKPVTEVSYAFTKSSITESLSAKKPGDKTGAIDSQTFYVRRRK